MHGHKISAIHNFETPVLVTDRREGTKERADTVKKYFPVLI
jgi:hypothetical protein